MKKMVLLVVLILAVSVVPSMAEFLTPGQDGSLTVPASGTVTAILKLSKNVSAEYVTETNGLGYVVGTTHSSGTKTYASSSGDSKIFSIDGIGTAIPTAAPTGTLSAAFGTGWTAL